MVKFETANAAVVDRLTKVYNKKFKLTQLNPYHKIFETINQQIKYEVDLQSKKAQYNIGNVEKKLFTIENYPKLYNSNSARILKMMNKPYVKEIISKYPLKSMQKTSNSNAYNEQFHTALTKVLGKEIKKNIGLITKEGSHKRITNPQSKVRQNIDAENLQKHTAEFEKKFKTLSVSITKKLKRNQVVINIQNPVSNEMKYSRSAYLSSLNYNFKNPL